MTNEESLGVVVEGPYDEAIYKTLIPRIAGKPVRLFSRACGGGRARFRRLVRPLLYEFRRINLGNPVDRVLLIHDTDALGPHQIVDLENDIAAQVPQFSVPFEQGVHICPIVREPETFLMADEDAINHVARALGGTHVSRVEGTLESIPDAKERFMRLLAQARIPYVPETCARIAACADLERLQHRCPSFRRFSESVGS